MNQPRDERSLHGQGCSFTAMLIIAVASRDFCIGRLEGWHVLPSHGTRNGSGTPARLAVVEGGRKQQRGRAGTRQHWSRPPLLRCFQAGGRPPVAAIAQ